MNLVKREGVQVKVFLVAGVAMGNMDLQGDWTVEVDYVIFY